MLGVELFKPLLNKGGGVLRIPPDLHGGRPAECDLQHDLHKLVKLGLIAQVGDQVVLDLSLNILSPLKNFFHSFHRGRRRCRWRGGGRGRE